MPNVHRRIDADVWEQKDLTRIIEVLNLKPGFKPGINLFLSTCSQEVSLDTGLLQQSFGAVQGVIAQSCTAHCETETSTYVLFWKLRWALLH
jgi:hypothetical protein